MKRDSHSIIVIGGPTASGKSAFALSIARELLAQKRRAVIINADSMQLYREIPILSAQPNAEEQAEFPHLLYGIRSIAEPCSAGQWVALAVDEITQTRDAGVTPIVVGGTGLYLKSLIYGLAEIPEIPAIIRNKATAHMETIGTEQFYQELLAKDPHIEGRIAPENRQRLIRAWEVLEHTNRSIVEWQNQAHRSFFPKEQFRTVFLNPPREQLYAQCNARFLAMVKRQALEEAIAVAAKGFSPNLPGMKALGLVELMAYHCGDVSKEAAIEKAQQATRNYAKRQITWFRHQLPTMTEIAAPDTTVI